MMTNLTKRSYWTEGTVIITERWMFEKSILWHKSSHSTLISAQQSSCVNTLIWWSGWDQTSACHIVITAYYMRRRRNSTVCPPIHWVEWQRSCWSHDCGTVLAGVGGAIFRAIWVNRRRLLLRHEASLPDSAPLTLGRFCGHTQTDGTYAARLKPALGSAGVERARTVLDPGGSQYIEADLCYTNSNINLKDFLLALVYLYYLHFMKRMCGICMLTEFAGGGKRHVHVQSSRLLFSSSCNSSHISI